MNSPVEDCGATRTPSDHLAKILSPKSLARMHIEPTGTLIRATTIALLACILYNACIGSQAHSDPLTCRSEKHPQPTNGSSTKHQPLDVESLGPISPLEPDSESSLALGCSGGQHSVERPINWNYQYVDEQTPEFALQVEDHSADQRLANIVRTTNVARLFYYFGYEFDSPIEGLRNEQLEQLAAGSRVNDTLCGEHLGELIGQMGEMRQILQLRREQNSHGGAEQEDAKFQPKHLRVAKILDSFGRYEAGLLVGRTHSLGSYTQCKGSQLLLKGGLVASRYCMANLDATKHQDADLMVAKEHLSELEQAKDYISVAVCLPESCHTRNFAQNKHLLQALVDSQFELPASMYEDSHLEVKSVFCEIDQDSPLVRVPPSGKLLLVFLALWIGVSIYSTYHNIRPAPSRQDEGKSGPSIVDKFVQSLNLRNSWDEFTCAGKRDFEGAQHRVSLDTLNPIKVIGCLCVVVGHSFMVHTGVSMDILRALKEMESDPRIFFIVGLTVVVDSFYVITGLVVSYIAMKRFAAHQQSKDVEGDKSEKISEQVELSKIPPIGRAKGFFNKCMAFIVTRYLRLVPLYFLVFWFKKSIMTTLSTGPLWDYGYNRATEAGACREESWLTPFTFNAAYLPLSRQCMPQAWSVASDLFFTIIMGPIIVLMVSRPKLAAFLSVAISVASNISMLAAFLGLDSNVLADLMDIKLVALSRSFKVSSFLYTAPHYRVFSALVGVLAGYVLHHYSQATDDSHKLRRWPSWFTGIATRSSLGYIVSTLAVAPLVPWLKANLLDGVPMVQQMLLIHMSNTNRLLWALSNAVVFLRMITDWKDNYWMRNSAGKFWASAAKLNFALLLVHVDLLKFDNYMWLNTIFYSGYSIARSFSSAYLFGSGLAIILYVVFENPMDRFVKQAVTGKK